MCGGEYIKRCVLYVGVAPGGERREARCCRRLPKSDRKVPRAHRAEAAAGHGPRLIPCLDKKAPPIPGALASKKRCRAAADGCKGKGGSAIKGKW